MNTKVEKIEKKQTPTGGFVEHFSNFNGKPMVKLSGYFKNMSQRAIQEVISVLDNPKEGKILREFASGEADAEILALGKDEILKPDVE